MKTLATTYQMPAKKTTSEGFPEQKTARYILKLPWPPSVNSYYGRTRSGQVYIKAKGKEFRELVIEVLKEIPERLDTLGERLQVWIEAFPPDRRRRDLDNIKKSLLDSLTHAGVYEDDCLIDDVRCVRREVSKPGHVLVHVAEL